MGARPATGRSYGVPVSPSSKIERFDLSEFFDFLPAALRSFELIKLAWISPTCTSAKPARWARFFIHFLFASPWPD